MNEENFSRELPNLGSAAVRGEAVAESEPMHVDVEWLLQCADEARQHPELATTLRNNVKAGVSARAADAPSEPSELTDACCDEIAGQVITRIAASKGMHPSELSTDVKGHATLGRELIRAGFSRRAAAAPFEPSEPEKLDTDQSREYLVKFMEQHFTDKTYHRYIRGERGAVNLAGDFAWQMARALRMIEAKVKSRAADALDSQPTGKESDTTK